MLKQTLVSKKYLCNIILAAAAIGTMVFYSTCDTSCSYLKGSVLGLDLQYVGIIFMAIIISLSLFRKDLLLLVLLSAGIGVEAFLVYFQVVNDVYCPFCLAFGSILVLLFLLNMDFQKKSMMAVFAVLGLVSFLIFFKGSVVPTYSLDPARTLSFSSAADAPADRGKG